jgi:hypothetical protein
VRFGRVVARANVNGGIEREHGRVHYVDFTTSALVRSTKCTL